MIERRGFAVGLAMAVLTARAIPARAALPPGKADRLIVIKSERRLYLVRDGVLLSSYRVALGRQPKGTKIYQGDGRTPEGSYQITAFNAASQFHRSLRVSYPNDHDRALSRALGQAAGGDIMIHGLAPERRNYGAEHWRFNWTNGCIAVTDQEIEEIWQRVEIGTPVEIRP
ncbi:MAG: murein L,D-transpeptidase family protein [Geminicoccaceae bacterium]